MLGLFSRPVTFLELHHGQLAFTSPRPLNLNESSAISMDIASATGEQRSVTCQVFPYHRRWMGETLCYFAYLLSPLPFHPLGHSEAGIRKSDRCDCSFPVQGLSIPNWRGTVRNLSLTGLQLESPYIMGVGQRWPIRIRTEHPGLESIQVEARVVWALGERAGMRFISPTFESIRQLLQLLNLLTFAV
ncbi:MAG: PilZ domain-containing protein [Candidatus Eremiobacteraeota bacterium]|nr:PilZ domain-containing protein [Candidatus Eremiobacteraeota bacterium]